MRSEGYGLDYGYKKTKDKYIKCPYCKRKLVKKKDGFVCKNWKCLLY